MATPRANDSTSPSSKASTTAAEDKDTQAAATKEAAIKARIIKHMNTEHAESLSLYLQHYSGLSAAEAATPKLVDISYDSLTIESSPSAISTSSTSAVGRAGAVYTIPVEPPMASWGDARPRVVAMDGEARAGLGLPPLPSPDSDDRSSSSSAPSGTVVITTYDPPRAPLHIFMIGLVAFFYGCYFLRRNGYFLVPGGWYWENVMRYFPLGGAEGYAWLQDQLAVPVVLLHGTETLWMIGRLRAHRVGMGAGVWWKWVGATFLEGFGAHQRFGGVVKRGGGVRKDAGRRRS
jgi:hypothetical protein